MDIWTMKDVKRILENAIDEMERAGITRDVPEFVEIIKMEENITERIEDYFHGIDGY